MIELLAAVAAIAEPSAPTACTLSQADMEANATLSFEDFDQKGSLPSTARMLSERSCWREAARATADYLIRGPIPTAKEQRVLLFHLGQQLAFMGDERRAADFIAATRRPNEPSTQPQPLNWNDYVRGTWAFLVKDRKLLIEARDAVLGSPGQPNQVNGNLLAALERCFEKPYSVAYDLRCGR